MSQTQHQETVTFDPSLTVTGYAVGGRSGCRGNIHDAGRLGHMTEKKRKESTVYQRLMMIAADTLDILRRYQPLTVIVETPAPQAPKKGAAGQARYGMAVGVVIGATNQFCDEQTDRGIIVRVILTDADDWTHGVKKETRQLAIADQYPTYDPDKDRGANVADAMGLLCWWAEREFLETQR